MYMRAIGYLIEARTKYRVFMISMRQQKVNIALSWAIASVLKKCTRTYEYEHKYICACITHALMHLML